MRRSFLLDLAAFGFFLLLACALLWPVVLRGEALLPLQYIALFYPWQESIGRSVTNTPPWDALLADSVLQYLPWRLFAHESIRRGFLPLWNPHQFCGTPFLANYQSALFYPLNLLFWTLPVIHVFGLSAILHLFLAGTFTYVYLRGQGVARVAAAVGGTTFELSGFLLAWLELPTALHVAVWLPLAFHFYDRARAGSGVLRGLSLTFPLAMILLAGHPQFAFYALLSVAAYALAHPPCVRPLGSSIETRPPRGSSASLAFSGCLAAPCRVAAAVFTCAGIPVILATLLAAAQILPTLELSRLSHRAAGPLFSADATAYRLQGLPLWTAVVLLLPNFFGSPGAYWGPANRAEFAGYPGVLSTLLAASMALGLLVPSWRARLAAPSEMPRKAVFFLVLAVVAALGSFRNPLGELLYQVVPGLGRFGSPGRMLYLYTVAVAILAGFGAHALPQTQRPGNLAGAAAGLLGVAAAVTGAFALVTATGYGDVVPSGSAFADFGRFFTLLLLGVALLFAAPRLSLNVARLLLLALAATDLLSAGWGRNPTAPPPLAYPPDSVVALLKQDPEARILAVTPRWSLAQVPIAVLPPNSATAVGLRDVNGYDSLYSLQYKTFLNHLAGRETSPVTNGNMTLFDTVDPNLLRRLGCRYVVTLAPLDEEVFDLVSSGTVHVYRLPGACPRAYLSRSSRLDDSRRDAAVLLTSLSPTRMEVVANNKQACQLVIMESFFPGWRAETNGDHLRVECADDIFLGVTLPAGTKKVTLSYQPASFRVGLFLSLLSISYTVSAGYIQWIKKRCSSR